MKKKEKPMIEMVKAPVKKAKVKAAKKPVKKK